MFTLASAYDFLAAKPNLSQTPSLLSFVQVLCTNCVKNSAEQKQCLNVGMPLLKLSMHAKMSTLYASGSTVMCATKISQLNGLP